MNEQKDYSAVLEKLEKAVAVFKGTPEQNVTIILTQVDLDAVGAAALFRKFMKGCYDLESTAYYAGPISLLNEAPINHFKLTEDWLSPLKEVKSLETGKYILLDSSTRNDSRIKGVALNPVIIIDHHDGCDIKEGNGNILVLNDHHVGACTTLVWELMKAHPKFDPDMLSETSRTLAALGIANDTHNLTDKITSRRDRLAWAALREGADDDAYAALSKWDLPKRYFDLLSSVTNSENQQVFAETLLVAHTGPIKEQEMDFLAVFADKLIQRRDICMVFVWAPVIGKGFAAKIRFMTNTENIRNRIQEVFGSGGGKSRWGIGAGATFLDIEPNYAPTMEQAEADINWYKDHTYANLAKVFSSKGST